MEAIAPLLLAVIIFVPFYLMIVRPHRQRLAEHDEIVAALKVGDEVMTTAGIYGTIAELGDEHVLLEVAPGTVIKLARRAIGARVVDDPGRAA
jgi:preprotein translocase subunit YajC